MNCVPPSDDALALLDTLELEQAKLLCWGVPEGTFSYDEVAAVAAGVLTAADKTASVDAVWALVQQLLDGSWLWQVPDSEPPLYRTRLAETVRLLSQLRQIFPGDDNAWRGAPRLVADYRLMLRKRVFPRRDLDVAAARDAIAAAFDDPGAVAAVLDVIPRRDASGRATLAGFQVRATQRVLGALLAARGRAGGTIVCAGTGSGKTLAFYLPALIAIASRASGRPWTKCLALYPRNELLKDQFREALANVTAINPQLRKAGRRAISVGALFGGTPGSRQWVANPKGGWKQSKRGVESGFVCPLARCPSCARDLLWLEGDLKKGTERLVCSSASCKFVAGPDEVRLTRNRMLDSPPDVLFTSTEMLNQRLGSSTYQPLLGIGLDAPRRPILMLLDEVHTNEGVHGAHVAMLIRRWRHLAKASPHMVGLSATLEDAPRFFADLVGVPRASVAEIAPRDDEMTAQGSEYLLALRGDPSSGASLLSTSIQALMLLRRVLGVTPDDAVAGSKVFAFTDNLDVVNRLFHNLLDAEGRTSWGAPKRNGGSLASLRASALPNQCERLAEGQNWDLVEVLGHGLTPSNRLKIERTTSQDPGVQSGADIVVATAALEVGFDDPTVGAVLQHKAPRSAAGFLQRKGRAGRQRAMRPWTVVVLSDYGRDRAAYQAYEHTFSPALVPRYLPLRNRAMLRMQATYVLFEWLTRGLDHADPWTDLAAPTGDAALRARQKTCAERLRGLLADEARQRDFTAYVAAALGLDRDTDAATLEALLWHPPRPVLMGAAPTLLRRLERSWKRAFPPETPDVVTPRGPPLPDFVQGKLFGDLLVPEVEIRTGADDPPVMLIAQALREFAPGRVSRRYGIEGTDTHWIDPGQDEAFDLASCCPEETRTFLGRFAYNDDDGLMHVLVFRPRALAVGVPPTTVLPSSNAFPRWKTQLLASAAPTGVAVPANSPWQEVVHELRFHMHQAGAPVEVRRFTPGCRTTLLRAKRAAEERQLHYVTGPDRTPSALGFVADVDALEVPFTYPSTLLERCAADGPLLRGLRPARFREFLRCDTKLDGVVNHFQRDWLADAYLAALIGVATAHSLTPEQAAAELERDRVTLVGALERMFLWAAPNEARAQDDDSDDADEPDSGGEAPARDKPKRLDELVGALGDPCVRASLRDAAPALWQAPDEAWLPWLRARYKATLAAAMLEAFAAACPEVDASVVLEDLDVHAAPLVGADDWIWLTESTLGGGGAIEAFFRAYASDPRRHFRLLEAALGPSDLERVAEQLGRVVEHAAGPSDGPVPTALAALRSAAGHAQTLAAVDDLRAVLAEHGIVADPSLLVALSARLLRPGAHRGLDGFLRDALRTWRAHEQRLGFDVDVRVFAAMLSHEDALDQTLGIVAPGESDEARAVWRYSALRSLLWARGGALRSEALRVANPFVHAPACDRLLVVETLPRAIVRVDLAAPGWFEAIATALAADGAVDLVADAEASTALADAMRQVGVQPIDTGGLMIHGRLAGVRREASTWVATFELPEAYQ